MLDEVKKLIKEQKFDQAIHQIDELLGRAHEANERLELLSLRLKISHDSETRAKILSLSFSLEKYQIYLSVAEREDLKSCARHFEFALSLYKVGSLHKSFEEFSLLSEKCFKLGYVEILKRIIELDDKARILDEVKKLSSYYYTLRTGREINIETVRRSKDERFSQAFKRHMSFFKHHRELFNLELGSELKDGVREQFIKHALEYVALYGHEDNEIIKLLSEYAIRFKCINLGHELSRWNSELEALFPEKIAEADVDFGEIDSAEDLFDSEKEDEAKVRGKVNALINLGQSDQAKLLLKNYLETNSKSALRTEFSELLTSAEGSIIQTKSINIDSVIEKLVGKINRASKKEVPTIGIDLDQRSIKSFLSLQEDTYLIDNFRDLISCFIMLEFYEASLWLIENIIEKNKELEREARFLRCDIYLLSSKYHYCLDETLAVWEKFDLDFDEELEILYKRAECYRLMGKRTKAIDLYREVLYRDANYRLAKIRLQEFE